MRPLVTVAVLSALASPLAAAGDIFSQPQNLCSALLSHGLTTQGWKASNATPSEWLCMTLLTPFGEVGANGLANNIAFYVNGTSPTRANDIRIKININNPKEQRQAFAKLEAATRALFKEVSEPIPAELAAAFSQQKPVSITTNFGKAELVLEPGRINGYKVVLTDSRFLAAKEQSRADSSGGFDQCKRVVASAAGYPATALSGKGDPVNEPGYKSFLINGRGKDIFFCEVHPGGRYKVKAALNGNYPFRYIAEGSF